MNFSSVLCYQVNVLFIIKRQNLLHIINNFKLSFMKYKIVCIIKVHIFWEGHKILRNLHLTYLLSTVHTAKSKVKISQSFVAFSEYMNFKKFMTQVWKRKRRKSKLLKKQQTKSYVVLIFLLEKSSIIRGNVWHGFINLRFTLHVKIFHVKSKCYSYLHENKIMFL